MKQTFASRAFACWSLRCASIAGPLAGSVSSPAEDAGGNVWAAVRLSPLTTGPETLILTPGEDDLALLVPAVEPLSAGLCPITPALVERIGVAMAAGTRAAESRAGYVGTCALETAARARVSVVWDGKTLAERNAVLAWLRDVCQHGRYGFDVELDGPGSGVTVVRQVAPFSDSWMTKPAYRITVECEEIF